MKPKRKEFIGEIQAEYTIDDLAQAYNEALEEYEEYLPSRFEIESLIVDNIYKFQNPMDLSRTFTSSYIRAEIKNVAEKIYNRITQ